MSIEEGMFLRHGCVWFFSSYVCRRGDGPITELSGGIFFSDCTLINFESCMIVCVEAHDPAFPGISVISALAYIDCCEMYVYQDKHTFFSELLHESCEGSKLCCFLRGRCTPPSLRPLPRPFERKYLFPGADGMLGSWSLTSSKLPSHLWQSTSSRN